jgi:hypothetical protein
VLFSEYEYCSDEERNQNFKVGISVIQWYISPFTLQEEPYKSRREEVEQSENIKLLN